MNSYLTTPLNDEERRESHAACLRRLKRCISAGVAISLLLLAGLVVSSCLSTVPDQRSYSCMNMKRNLLFALLTYHQDYGCLPPACVADSRGRPMHSWRVLLLPYLDQKQLYEQYDFSEPWDGPRNSKLHDQRMTLYHCRADETSGEAMASYVAVIGPDTLWPGMESRKLSDVTDGPSRTIAFVEIENSDIHWMEPRDITLAKAVRDFREQQGRVSFRQNAPNTLQSFGHRSHDMRADGSARHLDMRMSPEHFRSLLLVNDGGPNATP